MSTLSDTTSRAPGSALADPAVEQGTIRVLIADDHAFMRGLIRGLLSPYSQVQVVGEAGDGQEAVASAQALLPDVILMDVAMPRLNGIEATARVVRLNPRARVIALSMYMSPQFVLDMARAGASGYVVKDYAFEELQPAILAVTSGTPFVSERIASDVAHKFCDLSRASRASEGPAERGSDPPTQG